MDTISTHSKGLVGRQVTGAGPAVGVAAAAHTEQQQQQGVPPVVRQVGRQVLLLVRRTCRLLLR
jgi:hypothetical protein